VRHRRPVEERPEVLEEAGARAPRDVRFERAPDLAATGVEVRRMDPTGQPGYRLRSYWGIVDSGELRRIWGTTRDITGLRQTELLLEAAEHRYKELLESAQLVATLDLEGEITRCNDAFCHATGWSAGELVGQNWFDFATPPEEVTEFRRAFQSALEGTVQQYQGESEILTREGRRIVIAWVVVVMRDTEGKACGATIIARDIAEPRAIGVTG